MELTTEIGGLVVRPDYRSSPEKIGTLISFVRFLFIAMQRSDFRDELLAELLPPLEPDGTSHLWEALGRHFTGLSYSEADRLSKRNKEFIRGLFPEGEIYATLLPERAQAVIGEVGAQTRGVEKLLRRIGFRYAERVDPFDGGPHFVAPTDDVSLVRTARRVELVAEGPHLPHRARPGGPAHPGAPIFCGHPHVGRSPGRADHCPCPRTFSTRLDAAGPGPSWVLPIISGT